MYLADDHTHTRFSPDAHSSMTAMAQAAMAAGLDEICFTVHVEPLVWGSTELRKPYDWTLLTEDFRAAQEAVGDRIRLHLGMELAGTHDIGVFGKLYDLIKKPDAEKQQSVSTEASTSK